MGYPRAQKKKRRETMPSNRCYCGLTQGLYSNKRSCAKGSVKEELTCSSSHECEMW